MSENQQQTRQSTPEEDIRVLFSRTAKLNDAVSALLAPTWGSEMGIIPTDHPLHVGEKPDAIEGEQGTPVDWEAIAKRRERELKKVGEARHAAEEQLAEARQWARHGYEVGQRHCSWTDYGVAPTWLTEGWPRSFDSCEHLQQAAAFDETLTRIRALATRWQATVRPGEPHPAAAAILNILDGGGPTVREAAADDRAHWNTKYAGEGS